MSQNGDRRFPTVEALLNPKLQAAAAVVEGDFDTSNCPLSGGGGLWQDCGSPVIPKLHVVAAALEGDPTTSHFPNREGGND